MLIYPTLAKSDTQPVHETLVATHIIKMLGDNIGQPLMKPIQTITAGGTHFGKVQTFLQRYYESCVAKGQNPNFDKKKLGLVNIHGVEYRIIDIRMRMLKSRELFRGQGFPEEYIIDRDLNGKKISESDQVARCGNAVPPPFAKVLVQANVPELCLGSGNRLTIEKYAQREPGQMAFSM
ncbi:DNA cytosine methyltransferase [Paenibacillus sp. LS1]|uniref:DNA cytosine methyltransferase n=1 Tax=Paenibacillus sp. LS1 TaxID=2992120 RepID=UPI0039B6F3FF